MAYINPPAPAELAPETRDQLAAFAGEHRHFGELRAVVARFPAALRALDNQYRLIMGSGRLDRWVRDAVFAACSAERGNAYLARALTEEAVKHGADRDWVADLAGPGAGYPADDRVGSLITFSRKMARDPYKAVPGDVGKLHAAGWANEDLVEVLSVVSLSAYLDVLSLSLRIGQ
jgi:uncharacterized protein YciW